MIIANIISLIVLFIGGLNWGLVGIFKFNLVECICVKNMLDVCVMLLKCVQKRRFRFGRSAVDT